MTSPEFRNLQCTVHAIAGAIQARDRVLATELLDDVPAEPLLRDCELTDEECCEEP